MSTHFLDTESGDFLDMSVRGPRWWWCESASCADLLVGRETQLADQLSKFVFAQVVLNAVVGKSMIC